ncbi:MAG: DUF308 domain-containing protein [bacterium]|nr:DUF308 domain-containing protein [bacterium]
MNSLKNFFRSSIAVSSVLIVLGILLVFQSEFTIMAIAYIIGAILIALGVIALIRFFKGLNDNTKSELDIVYGIVTILLGILSIKNHETIASIIPFVLGIGIIISSSTKLQCAFELKSKNNPQWKMTMLVSIISVACGVILLFNPFKGAVIITQIVGVFIIIYGVLDITSTYVIKKNVETIHQAIEGNVEDVEVVDEEIVEQTTDSEEKKSAKSKKSTKSKKKS